MHSPSQIPSDPGLVIRRYLEEHGGEIEVPARHLLTTWQAERFSPDTAETIEAALEEARVSVSPGLHGLREKDRVTLRLAEPEPPILEPEPEPLAAEAEPPVAQPEPPLAELEPPVTAPVEDQRAPAIAPERGRLRSLLDAFGLKSPSRIAAEQGEAPERSGRS